MPFAESPASAVALVVAYADCHYSAVVVYSGTLNDLSLMKEYANRQDYLTTRWHNI